jgi:hypothetical protein
MGVSMPQFFTVSDNSIDKLGYPWIYGLEKGLPDPMPCRRCGAVLGDPTGVLEGALEPRKGSRWPDVTGCGEYPLLIFSVRVVTAWEKERLGRLPRHRVKLLRPFPKRLEHTRPPHYYWARGDKLKGALLDFKGSGFIGVKFCPKCGVRSDNIEKTYDRQHSAIWPLVFRKGTWTGLNLFTTDLSPTAFFCTEKLVECAAKHKLTNFRFVPVEEGDGSESRGVEYL